LPKVFGSRKHLRRCVEYGDANDFTLALRKIIVPQIGNPICNFPSWCRDCAAVKIHVSTPRLRNARAFGAGEISF
jgi:hypothetical protein